MNNLREIIKSDQTTIVDVRTYGEFIGGNVPGSINIPLKEIPQRIDELKSKNQIVLCCASGGRSMQAGMFLQQYGIKAIDAGSWLNVNNLKNN